MKLNNAQDAIEQAIKGGFDRGLYPTELFALLRPEMWQALGKARGEGSALQSRIMPATQYWVGKGSARRKIQRESYTRQYAVNRKWNWKKYAAQWFENRMSSGNEGTFWQSLP